MEGLKYDHGKLDWSLMPMESLEGATRVLMFGAEKYGKWNWQTGINFTRVFSATLRHLFSWFWGRQEADPETGESHLDHALCCLLFLRWYIVHRPEFDDRPGAGKA